jgi:serine/threonine protein kinase
MMEFISLCLQDKPEDRATINDLLHHPFLDKCQNDHDLIKLSPELTNIINKHCNKSRNPLKNLINGSSIVESQNSKSINDSSIGGHDTLRS